jgi:hypothetical protein
VSWPAASQSLCSLLHALYLLRLASLQRPHKGCWGTAADWATACPLPPNSQLLSPYLPPEAAPSPVLLLAQLWELAHAARLLSASLTLAELCEQAQRALQPGAAVQAHRERVSSACALSRQAGPWQPALCSCCPGAACLQPSALALATDGGHACRKRPRLPRGIPPIHRRAGDADGPGTNCDR